MQKSTFKASKCPFSRPSRTGQIWPPEFHVELICRLSNLLQHLPQFSRSMFFFLVCGDPGFTFAISSPLYFHKCIEERMGGILSVGKWKTLSWIWRLKLHLVIVCDVLQVKQHTEIRRQGFEPRLDKTLPCSAAGRAACSWCVHTIANYFAHERGHGYVENKKGAG